MSPAFAQIASYCAVPIAGFALMAASAVMVHGAAFLREKTHNEVLARLADAAARSVADGAVTLLTLPPGSDFNKARDVLVAEAATSLLRDAPAASVRLVANNPGAVETLVRGELGKLLVTSPGTVQPLHVVKALQQPGV